MFSCRKGNLTPPVKRSSWYQPGPDFLGKIGSHYFPMELARGARPFFSVGKMVAMDGVCWVFLCKDRCGRGLDLPYSENSLRVFRL